MPVFTSSIELSDDYPSIEPSLKLNFARSRSLDPRIGFTRGSIGTYINKNGLIKTAGENEPRFDHDPVTGESLGLLLEESRTNIAYGDASLSNTTAPGPTFNSLTGNNDAISFTKNSPTTSQSHVRWLIDGTVSTTSFVVSVFVQPQNTTTFFIQTTSSPADDNLYTYFDTSDGSTSYTDFNNPSVTVNAYIEDYKDGWKRLVAVVQGFANGNFNGSQVRLGFANPANLAQQYQNTTHQIKAYGIQVENGSFPTSYIPTGPESGAVSRSSETALLDQEIASGDITICAEYKARLNDNQWNRLFGFGEDASDIRPLITSNGEINFYNYTTEFVVSWPVSQPDFDTPFKFAMAVRQGVANSVVIDGGSVNTQTNTNPGAHVVFNQLYLGFSSVGTAPRQLTGHIKYFHVYNDSMTDAQLQLLTS
jgi:hypothetical protein